MGTSASSRGPGSSTPLVPPWAAAAQPVPVPEPARLRSFRAALGQFVSTQDTQALHRALAAYADRGTGGGGQAARRMGGSTAAGGALWGGFQELRSGGTGQAATGADLSACLGKPVDEAIESVVEALLPTNPDADKIRDSLTAALSECLQGTQVFDVTVLNDDFMAALMLSFMTHTIFGQIMLDSGKAFQKSDSPEAEVRAERVLFGDIKVTVDRIMAAKMNGPGAALSVEMMREIQNETIAEVWAEWRTR